MKLTERTAESKRKRSGKFKTMKTLKNTATSKWTAQFTNGRHQINAGRNHVKAKRCTEAYKIRHGDGGRHFQHTSNQSAFDDDMALRR